MVARSSVTQPDSGEVWVADEPLGLDPAAATAWITELGLPVDGPLRFERIGIGQSNLTYRVSDSAGHSWVLRRPPVGQLLASAHDVAREARILAALGDTDVPTPKVFGLTRDAHDVPLLLMEFVDGVVVDRMAVAQSLSAERRRQIGLSMPKTLAKIHAVDIAEVGLADLASHKPYAQRQLKRWSGQWEKSKTRELPALDDLTRRLYAAVPEQHELTLVHGDFHLRNVITAPENGQVIAVLDWELSTLGDPLADMGSLLAYWPEVGEEHIAGDFVISTLEGFPNRAELAQVYLDETGRDAASLQYWHALGLWKVAIIAEGIVRRVLDNPANKAAAGTPITAWIDGLVDKARAVADEAGI
ncbi:phosphotransferase family protein [Mycolicibacter arupensis]|uniref:phosphotransferase family protein n=1 Tax=Mycolicibacter arupensis TaxID=342002 RepID=UPI003B3BB698